MIHTGDTWYRSWFNTQDYLDLYKHRDASDAKLIISLLFNYISLEKGANVLDVACGNGRHSVLFAKKDFKVTGIDLSKFLVEQAQEKLKKEYRKYASNLKFEIKDMRHINHEQEFDLVVNIFTSFGYFDSDKDNEGVIRAISKAMKNKGYFLIDFLNKSYLENNLVGFDVIKEDGKVIVQIREIKNGFVEKHILIFKNNKNIQKYPIFNRFREKIRLYSLSDFESIFSKYGLRILNKFGSYYGEKYQSKKSERLILLAQKV